MKTKLFIFLGIAFILLLLILFSLYDIILRSPSLTIKSQYDYAASIRTDKKVIECREGERVKLKLEIKNMGRQSWPRTGPNTCQVSYHLLDQSGSNIQFDNRRFPLTQEVKPRHSLTMNITLRSPFKPGRYKLEFDLLREGISWFKEHGSPTAVIALNVKPLEWWADKQALNLEYGKFTRFHSSRKTFNALYKLIRFTLEQNEVEFSGKTGRVKGFFAGKGYPQIWLRDANTIIPASRYFYTNSFLKSWLEEHLYFQKENGSLQDWINSRGESDKNTTETDQEASAVQSAYQIFELSGSPWLLQSIKGKTIISRLEAALKFVLSNRLDSSSHLLIGAHTADWGDVDLIDEAEASIYVDERTHWTVDIYDQAMFYQAALNLAEMFSELEDNEKAAFWTQQAEGIKEQTNTMLWQPEKGFYAVHFHLDALRHDFTENNIFAMGGNTQAMLSGIADEQKCRQIIKTAFERQQILKLSTISGTLLPPYPAGTFAHPMLDEEYEYQNGGQWDWFGGKLIYAMYTHGYSRAATEKLEEIIQKNLQNRGFFEWDYPDGTGMGSDIFCGSAGTLGQALFQGYFGLHMEHGSISLEPKLGADSAKVHIYIPANDVFVAYDYSFNPETDTITMHFNSNTDLSGTIKILSPWLQFNTKADLEKNLSVMLDGQKKDFQVTEINEDQFIVTATDFHNHTLEITIKK